MNERVASKSQSAAPAEQNDSAVGKGRSAPPQTPSYLPARIATLILLILAVQFWLQHHFLISFWKGLTSGIVVSVSLSVTKFIWEGLFGATDDRWKQPLRKMAMFLIQTPVLITMAVLLGVAGSLCSTVTVIADGVESAEVCVFAHATERTEPKSLDDSDTVKTFLRPTNPFGQLYAIEVTGFRPQVVELRAWIGKRIRLNHDLQRVPTLLVRIPSTKLDEAGGYIIRLYRTNPEKPIAEVVLSEGHGSALFGQEQSIPTSFVTTWTWEAEAADKTPKGVANDLLRWHRWNTADMQPDTAPGMELVAKLLTARDDVELAKQNFVVTREAIQDILLVAGEP